MKAGEGLVGAQKSVLDRILGVVIVAQEPARQVVGGVQMREHEALKGRAGI
jgi:hypothetical protein